MTNGDKRLVLTCCITYCTDSRYAVTSFEIVEVLNFFSFEIGPLLYFFNHCFIMTCDFK